jgi:hypothetical protein
MTMDELGDKVFVTRRIPAAGLEKVQESCDAEVWDEQLPPESRGGRMPPIR